LFGLLFPVSSESSHRLRPLSREFSGEATGPGGADKGIDLDTEIEVFLLDIAQEGSLFYVLFF